MAVYLIPFELAEKLGATLSLHDLITLSTTSHHFRHLLLPIIAERRFKDVRFTIDQGSGVATRRIMDTLAFPAFATAIRKVELRTVYSAKPGVARPSLPTIMDRMQNAVQMTRLAIVDDTYPSDSLSTTAIYPAMKHLHLVMATVELANLVDFINRQPSLTTAFIDASISEELDPTSYLTDFEHMGEKAQRLCKNVVIETSSRMKLSSTTKSYRSKQLPTSAEESAGDMSEEDDDDKQPIQQQTSQCSMDGTLLKLDDGGDVPVCDKNSNGEKGDLIEEYRTVEKVEEKEVTNGISEGLFVEDDIISFLGRRLDLTGGVDEEEEGVEEELDVRSESAESPVCEGRTLTASLIASESQAPAVADKPHSKKSRLMEKRC